MSTSAPASTASGPTVDLATTAVYKVYIRATPEAIWQSITDPEWTVKYGYGGYVSYDQRPGGAYSAKADETMIAASKQMGFDMPDLILDGEVLECDPPKLLKQTWRMLMDPASAAEGFTTLTFAIEQLSTGYCSLTVTHECPTHPAVLAMVTGSNGAPPDQGGGGWAWILSDLKSLLETGSRM
jgi:uncharacterized protein YndB with AHSA1/START domain